MTTNRRVSRFNNDQVSVIEKSGSIKNEYLFKNGVLRTDINSTDPNKTLASFPIGFYEFSNQKIYEIFESEFSEFVDIQQIPPPANVFSQDQINFLQSRLDELTKQLDESSGFIALTSAQKQLIIELRILTGQGKTESDFSPEFPYNPNSEYLRELSYQGISSRRRVAPTNSIGGYGYGSTMLPTSTVISSRRRVAPTNSIGGYGYGSTMLPTSTVISSRNTISLSSPEKIVYLSNEPITANDVIKMPEMLPDTTIQMNNIDSPENQITYDDNNNILIEESRILPTDPIIK
jgi:hypothetical protein